MASHLPTTYQIDLITEAQPVIAPETVVVIAGRWQLIPDAEDADDDADEV